jgi:ATP/maltotriose-dependent transcriptional regulator MalT
MVPRLGNLILARTQLTASVENLLGKGHLWIEGPPGAGKTMLAAGYATTRPTPCAWYEIDLLDTDLVSLFSSFPKAFFSLYKQSTQPLTLPDPHPDDMVWPALFARKFFRTLFAATRGEWLLVLDNIHELPADSPVLEVLHICLQEVPVQCRVILLSRQPAPPVFARMKSTGQLQTLSPDMLRFNRDEIGRVMELHGIMQNNEESCIDYLHRTTAGWAAGLTLLLKEQNREICSAQPNDAADYQEVFDYFTGVVFAGLATEQKALLIRAALLPDIRPAILERFAGNTPCRKIFQKLSKKNFFTYAMDTRGELFQFHPLFRDFLRKQAEVEYSPDILSEMQSSTAAILLDANRPEQAVELLLRAGNMNEAISCIKKTGMRLLAGGRLRTLARWWKLLPAEVIENDPWLLFYFGNGSKSYAPKEAITMQQQSFESFRQHNNARGAQLACASLSDSIVSYLSDMSALDPCLDYLEQHLSPATFSQEDTFENILLANGIFRGLVMRRPDHPDLEAWLEIIVRQGGSNPALVLHLLWTGRFTQARSTLDRIYANPEKVHSQLQLSVLNALEIQYYLITAQQKKCTRAIDTSLSFIRENKIHIWEFHLLILGAACCLNCGDRKKAASYLKASQQKKSSARLLDQSYYHVVKTLEALLDDDLPAADRHQQAALDMANILGMPSYSTWCWYGSALVAVFQGNVKDAIKRFEQTLHLAASPANPWFTCQAHLGLAYMYLNHSRRGEAIPHLSTGFTLARKNSYLTFFFFLPRMMASLAVEALAENIEVPFVQRFIRHWQLIPDLPPVHLENWPWQLKIFTLGKFNVFRGDTRLDLDGRARKKPVRLLHTLIALGGQQVNKARLADILWPDSEGDEQAASLKVTLYRLRKILAVPDIIIQKNNWLSLNPKLCWVDSWQFAALAADLLQPEQHGETDNYLTQQALHCYTGDFLDAYEPDPTILSYQKQLRTLHKKIHLAAKNKKKRYN